MLASKNIKFSYIDITSGMLNLKTFLKIRDTSPAYNEIRGSSRIGIPCLQVDNDAYILGNGEQVQQLITSLEL